MCYASVYEAKTQLSKYISMIESGQEEEIIILKNGKKVAKITSFESDKTHMRLGAGKQITEPKPFIMDEPNEDFGGLFGY